MAAGRLRSGAPVVHKKRRDSRGLALRFFEYGSRFFDRKLKTENRLYLVGFTLSLALKGPPLNGRATAPLLPRSSVTLISPWGLSAV